MRILWLILSGSLVVLWRLAALRWPSGFIDIPDNLRIPFALLGILFLLSGLVAWIVRPGRWTGIFLLYGIGGGIHWGGAIGSDFEGVERALFFVYLSATALADAALLHLALVFPSGKPFQRSWKAMLYAPAALAMILAPFAGIASETIVKTISGVLLLAANLFSMIAGILFIVHLFRADAMTRRFAHLPWIVTCILLGSGLALLGAGGILPGSPDAWNLALGLIPVSIAFALSSPARNRLSEQNERMTAPS